VPRFRVGGRAGIGIVSETVLQLGLETPGAVGYLFGLFLYSLAAAVILPIPVELLLTAAEEVATSVKAVVLALGKAVGAVFVFFVGTKVNPWLERWMGRLPWAARILKVMEGFVRKTRWVGLMILLAIPLMPDTAVNYFYSLMNEEGHAIGRRSFVVANFVGGVVRTYLYLFIFQSLLR
jgi:uncharacterized membrane protein YdjX (TVP38/TMEM64 family)